MLYSIVKPIIRFALLIFCRKIYFNTKKYLADSGPLLLAVNHPNSFFDAIVIGVHFKQPVYFLARGDAFHQKWQLQLLTALHCIPVYRLREGKEYLHLNESTFEKCRKIFSKGGIVLIFSEGLCENEWDLRPLKKGTARLASGSWEQNIPLKILPVGINYDSFREIPKKIFINFGNYIRQNELDTNATDGQMHSAINDKIKSQLLQLCFHGLPHSRTGNQYFGLLLANADQFQRNSFEDLQEKADSWLTHKGHVSLPPNLHQVSLSKANQRKSFWEALFWLPFSLPALAGYYPLYRLCKKLVQAKAGKSVHYDSILFGGCTFFFLLLQPIVFLAGYWITKNWIFALLCNLVMAGSTLTLTKFMIKWQRFWNFKSLQSEQRISLQRLLQKQ